MNFWKSGRKCKHITTQYADLVYCVVILSLEFLMNIIFDELVVLCQFYEIRKCKFRKCHKYFIAKKGKEKNYCCKDCADKEIKYQIREGRRSKRERSC